MSSYPNESKLYDQDQWADLVHVYAALGYHNRPAFVEVLYTVPLNLRTDEYADEVQDLLHNVDIAADADVARLMGIVARESDNRSIDQLRRTLSLLSAAATHVSPLLHATLARKATNWYLRLTNLAVRYRRSSERLSLDEVLVLALETTCAQLKVASDVSVSSLLPHATSEELLETLSNPARREEYFALSAYVDRLGKRTTTKTAATQPTSKVWQKRRAGWARLKGPDRDLALTLLHEFEGTWKEFKIVTNLLFEE